MREIGRKVNEEALNNRSNRRTNIVDFKNKKLIAISEFYTPESETTLDWENLANLRKKEGGSDVHIPRPDGMGTILFLERENYIFQNVAESV